MRLYGIRPDYCLALRLIATQEMLRRNQEFVEAMFKETTMSDYPIVRMLRKGERESLGVSDEGNDAMKNIRALNVPPEMDPAMPVQVEEGQGNYVATIWFRKPEGGHQRLFAKGEREEGGTALLFKDWKEVYP